MRILKICSTKPQSLPPVRIERQSICTTSVRQSTRSSQALQRGVVWSLKPTSVSLHIMKVVTQSLQERLSLQKKSMKSASFLVVKQQVIPFLSPTMTTTTPQSNNFLTKLQCFSVAEPQKKSSSRISPQAQAVTLSAQARKHARWSPSGA